MWVMTLLCPSFALVSTRRDHERVGVAVPTAADALPVEPSRVSTVPPSVVPNFCSPTRLYTWYRSRQVVDVRPAQLPLVHETEVPLVKDEDVPALCLQSR